jgi:Tfp pilus assembly protein PilN
MPLAALCNTFRSRWQALTQQLWPETPRESSERELARLQGELARRYRRLLDRRSRIEVVRARLTEQEKRIVELSRQAPLAAGKRNSDLTASLHRLQRLAERNRDRLQEHEEVYGLQLKLLERKKRLRLALLRGDVVVLPHDEVECGG